MKKKIENDVKKRKKASAGGLGYCPFLVCTRSRYRELYRDIGQLGAAVGATTRPGLDHDTAEHAPRYDRPSVQRARSLGHGRVYPVHPTQS